MEILTQLATQGLGYTLFVLAVIVIIYQNKKLEGKDKELSLLHERILEEANLYTASFTAVAKEMVAANKDAVNATALVQRSVDSITQIVQALVNERK